jgi:hypothetical protein
MHECWLIKALRAYFVLFGVLLCALVLPSGAAAGQALKQALKQALQQPLIGGMPPLRLEHPAIWRGRQCRRQGGRQCA